MNNSQNLNCEKQYTGKTKGQEVYLFFRCQTTSAENGVPKQNPTVAFTKICFEAMLLKQKCFKRISLTRFDDFENKTQCTLYMDSWEKFLSDVGAKNSSNHPEQLASLYSYKSFLFLLADRKLKAKVVASVSYI